MHPTVYRTAVEFLRAEIRKEALRGSFKRADSLAQNPKLWLFARAMAHNRRLELYNRLRRLHSLNVDSAEHMGRLAAHNLQILAKDLFPPLDR